MSTSEKIFRMFDRALSAGLKAPAIRVMLPTSGTVLRLKHQDSARYGRTVWIDRGVFGTGLGFIKPGRLNMREMPQDMRAEVVETLRAFAEMPEVYARAYGKQCGECCYCGRELTDERSVDAGYGPVCAENYGLPWGELNA